MGRDVAMGQERGTRAPLDARGAMALLAAVVSARASSFLFSKLLLAHMGPYTLMGLRFLAAFALLALVFHRRLARVTRTTFLRGAALGGAFFVVMAFELHALALAPTSSVSFLENTAIVLVPLGEAIVGRRLPAPRTALAALVALAGVGLLTLSGGVAGIGRGEALALCAALAYAVAMMLTDRLAKADDALVLGILQVGWIGALGLVASLVTERPTLPTGGAEWASLAVLVVVCSGFGFTLQPVAQRPLSAETTSLMCALNPLVAAVLGATVLGERLGMGGVAGLALILASIVIAGMRARRPCHHITSPQISAVAAPAAPSGRPPACMPSRGE